MEDSESCNKSKQLQELNQAHLYILFHEMVDKIVRIKTIDGTVYRGQLHTIHIDEMHYVLKNPVIERSLSKRVSPPYDKYLVIPSNQIANLSIYDVDTLSAENEITLQTSETREDDINN
ncbi:hypothetical protein WA158_002612 [Blastocystis sp. Blastoise]